MKNIESANLGGKSRENDISRMRCLIKARNVGIWIMVKWHGVIWDLLHFFCVVRAREERNNRRTDATMDATFGIRTAYSGGKRERDRSISVFDEIGICSTFHAPSVDVYSTHVTVHQKFNMRCTLVERMFCWCTYMCASMCSINHCAHILLSYPRFFVLPSYLKDIANYYSSERLLIKCA